MLTTTDDYRSSIAVRLTNPLNAPRSPNHKEHDMQEQQEVETDPLHYQEQSQDHDEHMTNHLTYPQSSYHHKGHMELETGPVVNGSRSQYDHKEHLQPGEEATKNNPAVEDALRLCGITLQDTIDVIKAEGSLQSLDDFGHLFTEKQIGHFVESMLRSRDAHIIISYASARKLRGLAFWVRKQAWPMKKPIRSLTPNILEGACRDVECSAHRTERIIPSHYKTVDFDIGLSWFQWKHRILHKLRTMPSAIGGNLTLHYVVRPAGNKPPDRGGPWNPQDYDISLRNPYFPADNKTVALFLADVLMNNTPMYYALVRESLDKNHGRKAWLQLVKEAETEKRAKQRYEYVSKMLAEVKYTGNETEFPFHEYVAKMRLYFDMLDENGRDYRFEEFEKVFILLDQIQLSHPPFPMEMAILREGTSLTLEECIQKMSKIIDEHQHLLLKQHQPGSTNRQKKRRRIK